MLSSSSSSAGSLLDRAQQGSTSSLGRLMSLYANYLKLVVASQLDDRLRTRVSPSDVVQETFFEAHRDFRRFRGGTPEEFFGWMRAILINNLLRAVEQHVATAKRDVRREVSLDRMRQGVEHSTSRFMAIADQAQETPSVCLERRENEAALAEALGRMPPDYREVLRLRHMEGLPFSEIAERMERTSGAARMLWLRALKQLKTQFPTEASEGDRPKNDRQKNDQQDDAP